MEENKVSTECQSSIVQMEENKVSTECQSSIVQMEETKMKIEENKVQYMYSFKICSH